MALRKEKLEGFHRHARDASEVIQLTSSGLISCGDAGVHSTPS